MVDVLRELMLLVVGFVMLIKGADWFVDGASGVAKRFGVPQMVIGLTIVAMGTSAPEAAISISSALKGSADIAVGNVVGSNILNVLLILGITSLICPLVIRRWTIRYDLPFTLIITGIMAFIGLRDNVIGRLDGVILWVLFIVYMIRLFIGVKKDPDGEEEEDERKQLKVWQLPLWILVGIVCIVAGSDMTVDSASALAAIFGMSEHLIAVTIVAFGTSLPELVTCVNAASKGKADLAIGNIVGSNIFNILFVLGTSALITDVVYDAAFLMDSVVAMITVVLLFVCVINKERTLQRWGGAILLVAYAAYFVSSVL